jgi:hypothetical protein
MTPLKFFTRHWHDVGLVSAAVAGMYLAVEWADLSVLQRILIANFIVVLLHQFEEYSWPGGFPAVANILLLPQLAFMKPLNQLSSAAANCTFAYGYYLLPVFFPNIIWLGLSTFIVGVIVQNVGHTVVANYQLRSLWNPGVATALLGWLPLGVFYVSHIYEHNLITGRTWLAAIGYTIVAMYFVFYAVEQTIFGSDNPRYPFDEDEFQRGGILQKIEVAQRQKRTTEKPR